MHRALETGILDVWKKNNVPSMERCTLKNQDRNRKPKPIILAQLSSAFLILIIGLALALFSFLVEIFLSNFNLINY